MMYHSVSALGSSMGTAILWSPGAAIFPGDCCELIQSQGLVSDQVVHAKASFRCLECGGRMVDVHAV